MSIATAVLGPVRQKVSYEDFIATLDEDTRAEWSDGDIVYMSPISSRHQHVGIFLLAVLLRYVEKHPVGTIFYESYQMKTGPDLPGRQPDIMVLLNENASRDRGTYIEGPCDVVVEIVSLESRNRDRGEKYYEYEQGGVKEYWLIDPARKQAEFYRLGPDGAYTATPMTGGCFTSEVLAGLRIRPEWLWKEPPPIVPKILAEAVGE